MNPEAMDTRDRPPGSTAFVRPDLASEHQARRVLSAGPRVTCFGSRRRSHGGSTIVLVVLVVAAFSRQGKSDSRRFPPQSMIPFPGTHRPMPAPTWTPRPGRRTVLRTTRPGPRPGDRLWRVFLENVAITGRGVISSVGLDLATFDASLLAGKVVALPAPWKDGHQNVWMSLIEAFDPLVWMEDRVARNSVRFAHYAIAAAAQAVADAGIETFDPLRTAVIVGSALGGMDWLAENQAALDAGGPDAISSKLMANSLLNMPAAHIALRFGLHGPQLSIATACASSHDAMGLAARMIESGQIDVAITGGTDCGVSPLVFFGARNNRMFTPQPDPYKTCRPFNVERFGVMLGEGAGMFVLERADHARRRGATIHGRLRGYATLADGYHPSSPEPEGRWEQKVMELAVEEARLPGGIDDVDAVVAHGTGTPVGDVAELKALNRIYGARKQKLRVMSPKGNFGHPHGPAGALGLLAGMLGMRIGALLPTAGTHDERELMPEVGHLHAVIREPAPGAIDVLQVNAFGFGGQNSSLVVSRA